MIRIHKVIPRHDSDTSRKPNQQKPSTDVCLSLKGFQQASFREPLFVTSRC